MGIYTQSKLVLSAPISIVSYTIYNLQFDSVTTSLKCSWAHSMSEMMDGMSDNPVSVREYSTRGGTSAYPWRLTRLLCSRFFNVWESIFCEQSVIRRRISLNRNTPVSLLFNMKRTSNDHLSPKRLITCLMGQAKYSALISAIIHDFAAKVTNSYRITKLYLVNLS